VALINVTSPLAAENALYRQERLRRNFVLPMRRALIAEFKRTGEDAAKALEDGGRPDSIEPAMAGHPRRIYNIYRRYIMVVARAFGLDALGQLKSIHPPQVKRAQDEFEILLAQWIDTQTAERVVNVSNTTKRQIRAVMTDAMAEETPPPVKVANAIRKQTRGRIARNRADTIARTEMHAASTSAQDIALQQSGIEFVRQWVSAHDGRVRGTGSDKTDHRSTNNQKVGMKERFAVARLDGKPPNKMKFPGDPAGPADQVVNCRCVIVYLEPDTAAALRQETQTTARAARVDDFQFNFSTVGEAERQLMEQLESGVGLANSRNWGKGARATWGPVHKKKDLLRLYSIYGNEMLRMRKAGLGEAGKGVILLNNNPGATLYQIGGRATTQIAHNRKWMSVADNALYPQSGIRSRMLMKTNGARGHQTVWTRYRVATSADEKVSWAQYMVRHEMGHTLTTQAEFKAVLGWFDEIGVQPVEMPTTPKGLKYFADLRWPIMFQSSMPKLNDFVETTVSDYAKTNWRELVAEVFALYTADTYKAGTLPAALERMAAAMMTR
jgi:hypothetical protein